MQTVIVAWSENLLEIYHTSFYKSPTIRTLCMTDLEQAVLWNYVKKFLQSPP